MYTYCREILPPSAIEYTCSCSFRAPGFLELLVSRGNLLQLYTASNSIQQVAGDLSNPALSKSNTSAKDIPNESNPKLDSMILPGWENDEQFPFPEFESPEFDKLTQKQSYSLVLINQWRLMGKPRGIARIKGASKLVAGADKIIISFAVAKASVLEFDPATQSISTSSIHFYEHEKFQTQQTTDDLYNKVEVDPSQMCAVMPVYNNFLAVLSLTSYTDTSSSILNNLDNFELSEIGIKRKVEKTSFVVNLDDDLLKIKNVRDFVFLNDYNEPTLAILYEPEQTWAGTLSHLADSCCIAVVSVNIETDSLSIIYKVNDLPFDTFKLIPLTKPIGGIIAIASTSILHITQGLIVYIVATAGICKVGAGKHISELLGSIEQPYTNLDWRLDGAQAVLIGFRNILLWNELGELGLVELFGDVRGVNKIKIDALIQNRSVDSASYWTAKVDSSFALVPSSISVLDYKLYDEHNTEIFDYTKLSHKDFANLKKVGYAQALLFIATLGGSSLLTTVRLSIDQVNLDMISSQVLFTQDLASVDDLLYQDTFSFNENSYAAYIGANSSSTGANKNNKKPDTSDQLGLAFEIHDRLICAAPLVQIDVGESSLVKSGLLGEDNLEVVGSVGVGPQGGLVVMQRSIRPSVLASFDIAFTQSKLLKKYKVENLLPKNIWSVSLKNNIYGPSVVNSLYSNSSEPGPIENFSTNFDSLDLIITTSESVTTVFQANNGLMELKNTEFSTSQPTLLAGELKIESLEILLAVQVCSNRINVIDSDLKLITTVIFDDNNHIIQAEVMGSFVVVKMFSNKVRCYAYSFTSKTLEQIEHSPSIINSLHISLFNDQHFGFSRRTITSKLGKDFKDNSLLTDENVSRVFTQAAQAGKSDTDISSQVSDYWLIHLDFEYTLKIYLLPSMDCIWSSERIDSIPDLLIDSKYKDLAAKLEVQTPTSTDLDSPGFNPSTNGGSNLNSSYSSNSKKRVNQIRLANLGNGKYETYLVVLLASSQIIVYKSFSESMGSNTSATLSGIGRDRLDWKMIRVQTNLFTHFPDYENISRKLQGWDDESTLNEKSLDSSAEAEDNPRDAILVDNGVDNNKKEDESLSDSAANGAIDDDLFESIELADGDINSISNAAKHNGDLNLSPRREQIKSQVSFHFKLFEFNKLIPFYNMGQYNGVFILGAAPVWLLVGKREFPRLHPVKLVPARNVTVSKAQSGEVLENYTKATLMSSVIGWAPLFKRSAEESVETSEKHHLSQSSFAAITWSGTLVIATLPIFTIDYDNPWPTIFMRMGGFSGVGLLASLVYHSTTKNYITVSTQPNDFYLKENDIETLSQFVESRQVPEKEGKPEQQTIPIPVEQKRPDVPTTSMAPKTRMSKLELLSPATFETIDTFELEPNEIVTCMKTLMLESQQTDSGKKTFLVIGTVFMLGEDYLTRGHVYIFDIISVVPDPSNLERSKKFKRLCREEMRGGISSIDNLENNYLMVAVGNKLYARSFRDNENLVSVAFLDCQVYVKSIASIKNYFVVVDYFQSVWFAGFQDEPSKILVLGRDSNYVQASNSNFLVYDNALGILVADQFGNIQTFMYDPSNIHSYSGQKLVKSGDFHLGSSVTFMKRLVGKYDHRLWANASSGASKGQSDPSFSGVPPGGTEISHQSTKPSTNLEFCLLSCEDGALHIVVPVAERDFKKMAQIHNHILATNHFVANLNPKAYRTPPTNSFTNNNNVSALSYGFNSQGGSGARKYTLDANTIFDYLVNGSSARQREYCSRLGTNPGIMLNSIALLESSVDLF